jgi:hypothetical protein
MNSSENVTRTCIACRGTRLCQDCKGTGVVRLGLLDGGGKVESEPCPICKGTTVCLFCLGRASASSQRIGQLLPDLTTRLTPDFDQGVT